MSRQLSIKKIIENKRLGLPLNKYGFYPADYCKSTGLPMYNKETYKNVANIYLSETQCKKIGKPVKTEENPIAFYIVQHGYCGLYYRERNQSD